jgi:hypothetical protein
MARKQSNVRKWAFWAGVIGLVAALQNFLRSIPADSFASLGTYSCATNGPRWSYGLRPSPALARLLPGGGIGSANNREQDAKQ